MCIALTSKVELAIRSSDPRIASNLHSFERLTPTIPSFFTNLARTSLDSRYSLLILVEYVLKRSNTSLQPLKIRYAWNIRLVLEDLVSYMVEAAVIPNKIRKYTMDEEAQHVLEYLSIQSEGIALFCSVI